MRKLLLLVMILGGLSICAGLAYGQSIHNLLVTRHKANVYVSADGRVIRTRGCTVSAHLMDAVLFEDGPHSRLYFLDADREVEGECMVRSVRR